MSEITQTVRQEGANPHRPYYPALDGLRAVAVLMVFSIHYLYLSPGWMGVNIFFVLSGFLITGILFDSQDRSHRFRNFYVRRSLRIFPLYYAVWLILLLATPFLHIDWKAVNLLWPLYIGDVIRILKALYPAHGYSLGIISHPVVSKPFVLLYLNSGHFWSLCVEEQFYLIWPLMVFSISKRSTLLRTCVAGILVVTLLRYACFFVFSSATVNSIVLHDLLLFRFDEFLVGGAAALILRGPNARRLFAAAPWLFWITLGVLVFVRFSPRLFHHVFSNPLGRADWIFYFGITLTDALALGAILLCLTPRSLLARSLSFPPLRALGKISYGFYVFHDLPHNYYAYFMLHWGFTSAMATALLAFAMKLLFSIASYFLLERPFLGLKLRFEDEQPKPAHRYAGS